ncbi:MAG TPA: ChuX/HutX family heme-like substrate-binding protein [Nitrososphaeraceae archaeon]|nr:ChuX/HutX family heme-like substrate-binding protein [Nitrososphaeraceae archaeon]
MNAPTRTTFEELVRDIILLDDIMLSIKSDGAIAEVKLEKDIPFRVREQWATIGDEKGPWHVHVNIQEAKEAKFIIESSEDGRKRYSIRFFNSENRLILRVNFMKMYTAENEVIKESLTRYENLFSKYGEKETIELHV